MLTRLIYTSEACAPLNASAVDDILRNRHAKSNRHDITGQLMFDRQAFLQVLEGDHPRLRERYLSLTRDQRHRHLALLRSIQRTMQWPPMPACAGEPAATVVAVLCGQPAQK